MGAVSCCLVVVTAADRAAATLRREEAAASYGKRPLASMKYGRFLFFEGWIAACRVVKNLQFAGVEYADFTGLCRDA